MTGVQTCALPIYKAIRKCQDQNMFFDNNLIKKTLFLYVILLVLVFVWFIIMNANTPVFTIVINLCSIFALIKKIVSEFYSIGKLSVANNLTSQLVNNEKIDCMVIQSIIDQRRLVNVTVPNFLHKIMSNKLHTILKNADSLNI